MEVYERIRLLRKTHLRMSQESFGDSLGVNRSVIKNMELNLLKRPEQKEPLYKLICKSFGVSYDWLMTGQGEMIEKTKQSFIEKLSSEYGLSVYAQKIIECYFGLNDEQRDAVDEFIRNVASSVNKAESPVDNVLGKNSK